MNKVIKDLPQHLQEEEKQLRLHGINNWFLVKDLQDEKLLEIAKRSRATTRNLKRIRGMATLICEINLSQSEASLLLHAGVPSIQALASLTPSELIKKTGRLERQLNIGRKPYVDIKKASNWTKNAKRANSELTQ